VDLIAVGVDAEDVAVVGSGDTEEVLGRAEAEMVLDQCSGRFGGPVEQAPFDVGDGDRAGMVIRFDVLGGGAVVPGVTALLGESDEDVGADPF
jgi:hypothetical protein